MNRTGQRQETERTRHVDAAVSRRFRELREALGLTRTQVAADMGASIGRWQAYESGQRIPASRIWQFCRRYGLDVSEIYAGLPFTIGPVGDGGGDIGGGAAGTDGAPRAHPAIKAPAAFVPGMAEDGTAFQRVSGNPHDGAADDASLRAIAEAAAALNPLERSLALAALRGMHTHKAKRL
jgi:DNA-binding XRE family transcriptional regulator